MGEVPRTRVLVVDDEPDVCLLLRLQLEAAGFEVVGESNDGASAVIRCADTAPDAVVLDLLMPKMTGFEAIPKLREVRPGVVIVAYTAVAGAFVRQEMERLGVSLVLKSGDVAPLARAINDAVAAASSST